MNSMHEGVVVILILGAWVAWHIYLAVKHMRFMKNIQNRLDAAVADSKPENRPKSVLLNEKEPAPIITDAKATQQMVINDMRARMEMGIAKHGTPHQYDNGRDHLVDAYQEALDLCVYLRAAIEQRNQELEYINTISEGITE